MKFASRLVAIGPRIRRSPQQIEPAGLGTGPVGTWVGANKRALRITAVAAAALALVFWGRPTGKVVLGLTLALLVALAAIELLGRPARAIEPTKEPLVQ